MPTKRGQVRERIFRVLLNHAKEKLTKYRIAKDAQANISYVIKTLRKLEKENIVHGTEVKDYRRLVFLWKGLRTEPEKREYMVRDILGVLRKTRMRYALTTYSAENAVQKYLFPSRTDFYIEPEDRDGWHRLLSEKGLVGKGNVRVLMTDEHVFYKSSEKKGMTVVSTPQLIVDLLQEGGPCSEAAEMLMQKEEERLVPGR